MAIGQISPLAHFICKIKDSQENITLSDGNLLARFVAEHDETAFATLVKRHSSMVMAVCRRVLADKHQAEDAFQATFFVLARKAASIKRSDSLAGWLHGVARRTAMKARSHLRTRRERPLFDLPAPDRTQDVEWNDLRGLLDQEIDRLPEKYRVPFVLCYLQGKTNAQAAQELRCPGGTIVTRLARARARLRRRLTGRGLALSIGSLAALAGQRAAWAAVPAVKIRAVTVGALQFMTGQVAMDGPLYGRSFVLTKGVLKAMFVNKLKTPLLLLGTILIAAAGGTASYRTLAAGQTQDRTARPPLESAGTLPEEQRAPKAPDEPHRPPVSTPVDPARRNELKPLRITTFYNPVFEGGAIGAPVPYTLEISGLPEDMAAALATRMMDSVQLIEPVTGRVKNQKLSTDEKMEMILARLARLELNQGLQGQKIP